MFPFGRPAEPKTVREEFEALQADGNGSQPCDEVQARVAANERMTLRSVRSTAIAIVLGAWAGLLLAAPNDFYPALLKRGITHVGSGNFDMADCR